SRLGMTDRSPLSNRPVPPRWTSWALLSRRCERPASTESGRSSPPLPLGCRSLRPSRGTHGPSRPRRLRARRKFDRSSQYALQFLAAIGFFLVPIDGGQEL